MIARIKRLNSLKYKDVLFIHLPVSVNTFHDWYKWTSYSPDSLDMFTRGVRKKKFNTASNWAKF